MTSVISVPQSYLCSITGDLMQDPVIDPEGNSYERAAIVEWLSRNPTSPVTRAPLTQADLAPNFALRDAIADVNRICEETARSRHVAAELNFDQGRDIPAADRRVTISGHRICKETDYTLWSAVKWALGADEYAAYKIQYTMEQRVNISWRRYGEFKMLRDDLANTVERIPELPQPDNSYPGPNLTQDHLDDKRGKLERWSNALLSYPMDSHNHTKVQKFFMNQ